MTLAAGATYHFGYQSQGPAANHFKLAGRIIRHLKIKLHEAAPQQSPEISLSFDGNTWMTIMEDEKEDFWDLFTSQFWIRVAAGDDADLCVTVVYAQEFPTES